MGALRKSITGYFRLTTDNLRMFFCDFRLIIGNLGFLVTCDFLLPSPYHQKSSNGSLVTCNFRLSSPDHRDGYV